MTVLYHDPLFQQHRTGSHPESPARLQAIAQKLTQTGLIDRCQPGVIRRAEVSEIARLHSSAYIETVAEFAASGESRIESDTVVSAESYNVARHATGSALAAVDAVLTGVDRTALCLIRPPGHHALPAEAMGFCLFNNVALAAEHALRVHDLSRVLIIDWDVHHGNGTQDVFYDREDVWFFSAHRFPFYPGTGGSDETGTGRGLGATWNLPLGFGISRDEYLTRFERMLNDVADRCQPQLVLLSAGFDAHTRDPIGSLGLETEDFSRLTSSVLEVARQYTGGRVVSLLEGGYNVQALADCVAVHLEELLTTSSNE